jgi:hypothetical protein
LHSSVWSVIVFSQDSVLANVLVTFVHPTSSACIVLFVAIKELLDRVFL